MAEIVPLHGDGEAARAVLRGELRHPPYPLRLALCLSGYERRQRLRMQIARYIDWCEANNVEWKGKVK
jgi:hypothetical protein